MRLWHKDLIEVLPRQQLVAQWRECCAIAKSIAEKGSPNHILVNKIMDYPITHFNTYVSYILHEMENRGYKCSKIAMDNYLKNLESRYDYHDLELIVPYPDLFKDWHNERYLKQCVHNLQEKFDCGGITNLEWRKIVDKLYTEKGVVIF